MENKVTDIGVVDSLKSVTWGRPWLAEAGVIAFVGMGNIHKNFNDLSQDPE
jgi:hypothetical protein